MLLQPPPPALEVNVTPAKAGSEAAPAPATVKITLTGPLSGQALTVYFPQGLRISNTGLKTCTAKDADVLKGKCASAKAGSGTFTTADGSQPIKAFVGAEGILFRLGPDVVRGVLSQASGPYTAKLRLKLPKVWREVHGLTLTLKAQRGGASLFATRGCPLPFKTTLGATTLTADAPCEA